jgi:nicotinamide-nucleotide amidase
MTNLQRTGMQQMIAEVISIGDELTSGQRLDTNSQWLSLRLGELGIRVLYHTTVGDELEANVRVFRQALERADVIIATGGLGPTADDLTREVLAQVTGRELHQDEGAVAHIRAIFARRKREMPERNLVQALFPVGSRVVPNPDGTAPGIDLQVERAGKVTARIFALPGVPAEMREMWEQTVSPELCRALGERRRVIRYHTVNCFGVGESDLEAMLPDMIRRGRRPTVGITVSKATISLRITAEGASEAECAQLIQESEFAIRDCLGDLVFGQSDEELQHAVVRLGVENKITLAVGEVGSGGLLTEWLSQADATRAVFVGGLVPRLRATRTAEEVEDLAKEARQAFGADIGLALSDFPRTDANPAPRSEIHVAVAGSQGAVTASFPFTGHPEILYPRAAKQALNFLRLLLVKHDPRVCSASPGKGHS